MAFYLYCLIIICGCLTPYIHTASKIDYYNLHNSLFSGYISDIRPVALDTEVMQIQIDFSLVSISELQEKDQTLVSFGFIYMFWKDDFLSWDETVYNGLTNMVVPQKKVWRPDIIVANSVEKRTKLGFDEMPIRLNSLGYVDWEPSNLFKTSCDINIQYYPFDTQVCSIILETTVSKIHELNLVLAIPNDPRVILEEYSPNGQWDLISTSMEKQDETYKSALHIKLTLKRRRTFYIMNIIIPILMLSIMGSLTFALPADAGEKMSLSITVLLAYVVFLTIISDSMPQTSLQVSILGIYLTILLGLSALSVLISVPILRLHHRESSIPVPSWCIRFVSRCCGCRRSNATFPKTINHTDLVKPMTPINQNYIKETEDGRNQVTWQHISKCADAILFWMFMIITIIATAVFILLLSM